VAFAALQKFDGRETRPLELAEVGQIAGRAGRHTKNGTFGVVSELDKLFEERRALGRTRASIPKPVSIDPGAVKSIERHQFARLKALRWRNRDLDFTSIESLLESLEEPSPHPLLRRTDDADDHVALRALAERPDIRKMAETPRDIRLLLQVATVPDFRKLLLEDHIATLAGIYRALMSSDGTLERAYLADKLDAIERPNADMYELVDRLALTRLCSYIAHQDWVEDSDVMCDRAGEVEERLGDLLHTALRDRFVTRKQKRVRNEPPPTGPFAVLAQRLAPVENKSVAERIASARHEELSVTPDANIRFDNVVVARMISGKDIATPDVRLILGATPSEKLRAERRLTAFARDDDRLQALHAGFQLHLAKPIDERSLVTAVASLGEMSRTRPGNQQLIH